MWGGSDLSYLSHIIIAHYNASYRCGKCLKRVFVSCSALHNHKKVCIGLIPKKSTRGSGCKPSSRGAMAAMRVLAQLLPRRMACSRLPGLQCPSHFADITMPWWMRDVPPPQVHQGLKGLWQKNEKEEEEECKPYQKELQAQGV